MLDDLPSDILIQLLEILLASGSIRDFLSLSSTCSRIHRLGNLLEPAGQAVPKSVLEIASNFGWRSQLLAEAKASANKPISLIKVITSSYFTPPKGDAEETRVLVSDGSQLALYDRNMELLRGWVPPHAQKFFCLRTIVPHAAIHSTNISNSLPAYTACCLLLLQPLKPLPTHGAPILSAEWPPQPFCRPRLPLPPCLPVSKPPPLSPLHLQTYSRIREGRGVDQNAAGTSAATAEQEVQFPRGSPRGVAATEQDGQSPRGKLGDLGWQFLRSGGRGTGGGQGCEGQQGGVGRGVDFGGSVVAVPRPPPPPPPPPTAPSAAGAKSLRKRAGQAKEAGPERAQEDVAFQMLTRIPCLPTTTYLDISHHISLSDTDLAVVLGKCTRGLRHLALAGTQAGQCTLLQLGAKGRHNLQALDLSSLSTIGTHNPLPPQYLHSPAPATSTTRCPAPCPQHSVPSGHRMQEKDSAHMASIAGGGVCNLSLGRKDSIFQRSVYQRDVKHRSSSTANDSPAQHRWARNNSTSSSSSSRGSGGWSQRGAHCSRDGQRARAYSSSPVRGAGSAIKQRQQQPQSSHRGVSSVDLVSGHLGHWGLRHRHPSLLAAEIENRRRLVGTIKDACTSNDTCKAGGAAVDGEAVADAHGGNDGAEDGDYSDDGDDGDCQSHTEAGGVEGFGTQTTTSAEAQAGARQSASTVASPWQLPLDGKGRAEQQRERQHMGSSGSSSSSWSGGEHAVFVRLLRCTLERLPELQDVRLCSNHLWGLFEPLPFSPKNEPSPQAQGADPLGLGRHQQQEQSPSNSPQLRSLANLRVLHLAGSTGLRAQSLAIILLHCPNLVDLDVHECIDLNAVASGTSLAELLQPYASCLPSLRRLKGGWGLCAASLQLLLCHPGRAYALTSLDLGVGAGVNDVLLGQLAAACTNLQEVRLTLAAVTDQGINDLLSGCRKLHVLVLLHCLGPFTPALLPNIPPTLQQQGQGTAPENKYRWTLSNLQVIGGRCTLLSSHITQLIGTRPNTLHTLALSNCPYITPALLGFLSSHHRDSLRHVRLEQCGGYSWVQPSNRDAQGLGPHSEVHGPRPHSPANSNDEDSCAKERGASSIKSPEGSCANERGAHSTELPGGCCSTDCGGCYTGSRDCSKCGTQGGGGNTNTELPGGCCSASCGCKDCNKCGSQGGGGRHANTDSHSFGCSSGHTLCEEHLRSSCGNVLPDGGSSACSLLRDGFNACDASAVSNGPAPSLAPSQALAPQQNPPPLPVSRLSASVWPIDEASITQLAAACTQLCSLHLRHCCQLSAGIAEELTSTCPQLSSVLLDRCDLRDGGVRCPQSSFHPLHRIMVARCRLFEPSLIPQPLFGPAALKSAQGGSKEGLSRDLCPGGATREVPARHHRVDAAVMVHDLRAGGTAVLHAA